MLNKNTCMEKYPGITEGMTVLSNDGEKLGRITSLGDDSFTLEKGFFFPKEFYARYDDIQGIQSDELILSLGKADLAEWKDESYAGWSQTEDINQGRIQARPRDEYQDRYAEWNADTAGVTNANASTSREHMSMPLAEEQLEAQKTLRKAGEVRVRKVVHTEYRHFTVPVMKEEVRIERGPVTESTATDTATLAGKPFQEDTMTVPIMEEEVTVSKRPVVKEEVRLTKERRIEEQDVSGEVRKEEADIQKSGDIKKKGAA